MVTKKAFIPLDPVGGDMSCSDSVNTAEQITYSADPDVTHILEQAVFSYSDTPTGGYLEITMNSEVVMKLWITQGGPGPIVFNPPISAPKGSDLVVTLAAGGAVIKGSLACTHWELE